MTASPRQLLRAALMITCVVVAVAVVVLLVTPHTHVTPDLGETFFDHGLIHEIKFAWYNLAAVVGDPVAAAVTALLLPVLVLLMGDWNPTTNRVRFDAPPVSHAWLKLLSLTICRTGPPASV